jgi:hypothetical protein
MVFHRKISRHHEYYFKPSREALGNAWQLLEKNSRLLKFSWSTFQPRDDSSILENFRLVELEDAQGLLAGPSRQLEAISLRLQNIKKGLDACELFLSCREEATFA